MSNSETESLSAALNSYGAFSVCNVKHLEKQHDCGHFPDLTQYKI